MKTILRKLLALLLRLLPQIGLRLKPLLEQVGDHLPDLYDMAEDAIRKVAGAPTLLTGNQKHTAAVQYLQAQARQVGISLVGWMAHQIIAQAFSALEAKSPTDPKAP